MRELTYTLVAEGSSDRALIAILDWLFGQVTPVLFQHQMPDLRLLRTPATTLEQRIRMALELAPCELLLVHRDADREPRAKRVDEIHRAVARLTSPPEVCVVPVRMTEAWLLFDEQALRQAAGNPNAKEALDLPPLHSIESLPDPKSLLTTLLRRASGLSGRRLRRWSGSQSVHRLANLITDFSPLRALPAFLALEEELRATLGRLLSAKDLLS